MLGNIKRHAEPIPAFRSFRVKSRRGYGNDHPQLRGAGVSSPVAAAWSSSSSREVYRVNSGSNGPLQHPFRGPDSAARTAAGHAFYRRPSLKNLSAMTSPRIPARRHGNVAMALSIAEVCHPPAPSLTRTSRRCSKWPKNSEPATSFGQRGAVWRPSAVSVSKQMGLVSV